MKENLRVFLVAPPVRRSSLYGDWDLSSVDSKSPPIGLLTLGAVLRKNGVIPHICDAYSLELDVSQIIDEIIKFDAEIIGISCTTMTYVSASLIAKEIKKTFNDKTIIIGGPHVTAMPEDVMKENEDIDFAVFGEGENTIIELLESISNGIGCKSIAGTVYRENGSIRKNESREFIKNLDEIPFPAWDLLPSLTNPYRVSIVGAKGKNSTSLLTSRGCPGNCTFCDTGGVGRKIRAFSADYVIAMMDHLIGNYKIEDFLFYDDTFVALKKRTVEICEKIISSKWNIRWTCCARANLVNPELLALMRKAGCWQIEYGLESGSEEILKLMKKNVSLKQVEQALRWTKQAGIETRGNFIFGFLGETKDTLAESLKFALRIDLDYFQQTFLTPYPGSELYGYADQYGTFERDYEKMNNLTINFVPKGMTKEELRAFSAYAFKKFYIRPKTILHHLAKLRSFEDIVNYFKAFSAFAKTVFSRKKKMNGK